MMAPAVLVDVDSYVAFFEYACALHTNCTLWQPGPASIAPTDYHIASQLCGKADSWVCYQVISCAHWGKIQPALMLTFLFKPCSVRNGLCASVANGHSFRHHVQSASLTACAAVRSEAASAENGIAHSVGHRHSKSEACSLRSVRTCKRRKHAIVVASTQSGVECAPETAESAFLKDFFETGARMTRATSNVMRCLISPGDTVCDATVGRQPSNPQRRLLAPKWLCFIYDFVRQLTICT